MRISYTTCTRFPTYTLKAFISSELRGGEDGGGKRLRLGEASSASNGPSDGCMKREWENLVVSLVLLVRLGHVVVVLGRLGLVVGVRPLEPRRDRRRGPARRLRLLRLLLLLRLWCGVVEVGRVVKVERARVEREIDGGEHFVHVEPIAVSLLHGVGSGAPRAEAIRCDREDAAGLTRRGRGRAGGPERLELVVAPRATRVEDGLERLKAARKDGRRRTAEWERREGLCRAELPPRGRIR